MNSPTPYVKYINWCSIDINWRSAGYTTQTKLREIS